MGVPLWPPHDRVAAYTTPPPPHNHNNTQQFLPTQRMPQRGHVAGVSVCCVGIHGHNNKH